MGENEEKAIELADEFMKQFQSSPGDELIKEIEEMIDTGVLKPNATLRQFEKAYEAAHKDPNELDILF